ncbi:lipocalin-15 [Pogona vitticeps]
MATLHSLLMLLLGVFCTQAEVPVQPDFDLEKFSGTWHIMAAVSNCPIFQSMRDTMTTSAAIVKPLPNGDMHLMVGYPIAGECKKVGMLLKKTDWPGHFTNEENGRKDIRVMATDYETHGFLYYFKEVPGEPSSTTLQLLTRGPEATPEMMEKFKEHYHNLGLTDDLMVALPESDVCAKMLSR